MSDPLHEYLTQEPSALSPDKNGRTQARRRHVAPNARRRWAVLSDWLNLFVLTLFILTLLGWGQV